MPDTRTEHQTRVLLVVSDKTRAAPLHEKLVSKGVVVTTEDDPHEALVRCQENPPDLAVVEDSLSGMTGIRFLGELLKISWTTATILIADEDDEIIHERAEGLGILGHVRGYDDLEALERLFESFYRLASGNPVG